MCEKTMSIKFPAKGTKKDEICDWDEKIDHEGDVDDRREERRASN